MVVAVAADITGGFVVESLVLVEAKDAGEVGESVSEMGVN